MRDYLSLGEGGDRRRTDRAAWEAAGTTDFAASTMAWGSLANYHVHGVSGALAPQAAPPNSWQVEPSDSVAVCLITSLWTPTLSQMPANWQPGNWTHAAQKFLLHEQAQQGLLWSISTHYVSLFLHQLRERLNRKKKNKTLYKCHKRYVINSQVSCFFQGAAENQEKLGLAHR